MLFLYSHVCNFFTLIVIWVFINIQLSGWTGALHWQCERCDERKLFALDKFQGFLIVQSPDEYLEICIVQYRTYNLIVNFTENRVETIDKVAFISFEFILVVLSSIFVNKLHSLKYISNLLILFVLISELINNLLCTLISSNRNF